MSIFSIRSRTGQYLWIAGAWIIFGFADGLQTMIGMRAEGMQHAWTALFWTRALSWGYWALASPAVLVLARRYPLMRKTVFSAGSIHLVAWTVITLFHAISGTFFEVWLRPWGPGTDALPWTAIFEGELFSTLQFDLIIYIAIVAVSQVIQSRRELARRELEAERVNVLLWQAQLIGLRHQLEPHFLFNALNGISGLVRDNRKPAALEMLAKLGDLLRHLLQDSQQYEISLDKELEFLRQYVDLQQMRFGHRLRVLMDVPRDIAGIRVPRLFLQPIVENSIRHGIEKKEQGGVISVSASQTGELVQFRVANDGPPLRVHTDQEQKDGGSGTGLSNIRARLLTIYGTRAGLIIRDCLDGGVETIVTIPNKSALV